MYIEYFQRVNTVVLICWNVWYFHDVQFYSYWFLRNISLSHIILFAMYTHMFGRYRLNFSNLANLLCVVNLRNEVRFVVPGTKAKDDAFYLLLLKRHCQQHFSFRLRAFFYNLLRPDHSIAQNYCCSPLLCLQQEFISINC